MKARFAGMKSCEPNCAHVVYSNRADVALTAGCLGLLVFYTHGLVTQDRAEALFEEEMGLFLTAIRTGLRTVRLFQQIKRQHLTSNLSKVDLR
jgi:hypothetical protein